MISWWLLLTTFYRYLKTFFFFLTEYDFYGNLPYWVIFKHIISFLQEKCGVPKTITWICDMVFSLCKDFTQTSIDVWVFLNFFHMKMCFKHAFYFMSFANKALLKSLHTVKSKREWKKMNFPVEFFRLSISYCYNLSYKFLEQNFRGWCEVTLHFI